MSSRNCFSVLSVVLLVVFTQVEVSGGELSHTLKPGLGTKMGNVKASIVSPDGSGLPLGGGTVFAGEQLYKIKCASCHGIDGKQAGNLLVGGVGSLASEQPVKTVGSFWPYATTLYDYIARAMPYDQQKSLSVDEVYSITAYVLKLNGILGHSDTLDQISLPLVEMPNRFGFVELIP